MDRNRILAASHSVAFGVTCGAMMAFAAASSFAAARFGMLGGVAPDKLVVLRFLIASVFFLPFLMRWGLFSLAGVGWPRGLTLLLAGGPVFAWLQFAAYRYAPLAHGAIINPPTVAILSTIAAAVFLKERISGHHVAGAALVIGGVVLLGWDGVANTVDPGAWIGDLMFVASAVLWACFTVLLRHWRLSAVRAVAVVSVLSTIILLPVYAISGELRPLLATSSSVLLTQGLVQGLLQGLIGTTAYSHAIRVLGVSRAVLFPATIPALAILPGIPIIGEKPSAAQIAGLGVVTTGLLVASGIWRMFRRRSITPAPIMIAVWTHEDV
jgi:drug/metabolite transporter (DMT)-like permease